MHTPLNPAAIQTLCQPQSLTSHALLLSHILQIKAFCNSVMFSSPTTALYEGSKDLSCCLGRKDF